MTSLRTGGGFVCLTGGGVDFGGGVGGGGVGVGGGGVGGCTRIFFSTDTFSVSCLSAECVLSLNERQQDRVDGER